MRADDFDYDLPSDLIAQTPAPNRDASRLLQLSRPDGQVTHQNFTDLPSLLHPGDLLVINNSRVINARLRGINERTGGRFELLLTEEVDRNDWWAMTKPGRRATIGTEIRILDPAGNVTGIVATTINYNSEGHRRLSFAGTPNILQELDTLGEVPLPPYIKRSTREAADADRYQTVYAARQGSLAAPTAGLHFTPQLLTRIQARGVDLAEVTLHVGLGTFAPVKVDDVRNHHMHEERYAVTPANADRINTARSQRRRIVAVGTTTLRVLESIARQNDGQVIAGAGRTTIFIYPPSSFCAVDALITNFHLPRSTLLMLTSAFASPGSVRGRDLMLQAYAAAIRERYRFFSYGDAMLIQ